MNEPNIKERFKAGNSDVVPEIVEERLNETFRQIRLEAAARENGKLPACTVGDPARSGRPKRMLRFFAVAAAALLLTASALAGLSVLSPTFAQTLQRFPLLGTLYSDKGIEAAERQGLVQSYPSDLQSEDVPFGIRSIIYDGTRLVFDVYSKKSKADEVLYHAREIKKLSLFYKGQELPIGYSPVNEDTNVVTFDAIEENHMPDTFELTLRIQTGANEKPYELKIPAELNTSNTVIEKPETPEELKKRGISVEKIVLTPITTQVVYRSPFTLGISEVYLNSVIDERGGESFGVGGYTDPLPENTGLLTSYRFEPIQEGDREVTFRFDVITKDSKLLRKIDMTVPIPASESGSQPE